MWLSVFERCRECVVFMRSQSHLRRRNGVREGRLPLEGRARGRRGARRPRRTSIAGWRFSARRLAAAVWH